MRVLPFVLLVFSALLAAASAAQTTDRVLAFGDSITIGFREPGVSCDRPDVTSAGYPDHLEQRLVADGFDLTVDTAAKCGETTFEGITRIDQVMAQEEGRVIVVMEGTNDVSRGGSNTVSNETIVENLTLIAGKIRQDGRVPVMSSILPYGPGVDGNDRNPRAAKLSDSLRERARELGVPFADPFNDLLRIPDLFATYYDADGFHLNAPGNEILAESFFRPTTDALGGLCEPAACVPGPETLCLADGKFSVTAQWRVGDQTGVARVNPLPGGDTGTLWFFSPDNLELVVKVLDGRCNNGAYWVFYGGLSDVEFEITVTETETCRRVFYDNPPGEMASVGDTGAFPAACPNP